MGEQEACEHMEIGEEGRRWKVLRELDKNIEKQQKVRNVGMNKNGVWRRKSSRNRTIGRLKGEDGLENQGNRICINDKKEFGLIDGRDLRRIKQILEKK